MHLGVVYVNSYTALGTVREVCEMFVSCFVCHCVCTSLIKCSGVFVFGSVRPGNCEFEKTESNVFF